MNDLFPFVVELMERHENGVTDHFDFLCEAEDFNHAMEQAMDEYPNAVVLEVWIDDEQMDEYYDE